MSIKMFNLGDKVTWTSQSAGRTQTKTGFVTEVLYPGATPVNVRNCGRGRNHESYVVKAEVDDRKGKRNYWPRAAQLEHVSIKETK